MAGRYDFIPASEDACPEAELTSEHGPRRQVGAAVRISRVVALVALVALVPFIWWSRAASQPQDKVQVTQSLQLDSLASPAIEKQTEGLAKRAQAPARAPDAAGASSAGIAPLSSSLRTKTPAWVPRSVEEYIGFGPTPPEYPLPYRQGEWPTSYDYSGRFPDNFVWGTGTSAFQIEGAYREDGKGASIWDTFTGVDTAGMPGETCRYCCTKAPCQPSSHGGHNGATGSVANDHYHMWKTDVAMIKSMGLKHYRFSIAWSRLIPSGRLKDGINQKGIDFYNTLIDHLLEEGVTPYVTLYHWDLPQGLLDPPQRTGWYSVDEEGRPNGEIIPDWLDYVDLCFKSFGNRVGFWITFNEPWTFLLLASGWGSAPSIEPYMNMTKHPYIGGHNVLNAHAAAVDLYRRKYQKEQQGIIGITNNVDWNEPMTDDPQDVAAAERGRLFNMGWFTDPIYLDGDYPVAMRRVYGERLPNFTTAQKQLLRGSADFFGLNHYTTTWTGYNPDDPGFEFSYSKHSSEGFPQGQASWLHSSGWGFRKLLAWISRRYGNPPLYVTESGWAVGADTAEDGMRDPTRVQYYANYTAEMRKAIDEDGVDVRGYFAWSLMDNLEWSSGYTQRFGIIYNDFAFGEDPNAPANSSANTQPTRGRQVRSRKDSSCWLEKLWRHNELHSPMQPSFQGCPGPEAFQGQFTDSSGCTQRVDLHSHNTGEVRALGGDSKCGRATAEEKTAPLKFSGGTIIADFSSRGGPSHMLGFWDSTAQAIEWGDGTRWEKLEVDMPAHVK